MCCQFADNTVVFFLNQCEQGLLIIYIFFSLIVDCRLIVILVVLGSRAGLDAS